MNAFDYFFEKTKNLQKDFVLGNKEKISYSDLYQNAIKLANHISNQYDEDEKILIIASNSVYFITLYLAILKSGRICVPLNPEIEQNNFEYISKECNSTVLFIQKRFLNRLKPGNINVFCEDDIEGLIREHTSEVLVSDVNTNDCAELIFTSGSTGVPKGVMLSHNNLVSNTESIISYLSLTSEDIVEIVMPFYYCYGLSLLHTHLRIGGSVVFNNSFIFLGSVLKDLKEFKCTGFAGVPSHFQILLRKSKSFKDTKFDNLRYVTQAGGKLHDVFIQEFLQAHPTLDFYVMYGQTEATARLSYLPIDDLKTKLGSIGKGIPGVKLQVRDENGNEIKAGDSGEIYAKGDNIMLGYLNDPDLTQSTLVDGWLKTGDLATIDEDGYIFLTARKKEIIKVGGKRISPKEIEEVLVSIPEIIDCTITSENDDILGESIVATITTDKSNLEKITTTFLKEYCGNKLAIYKIPSKFIIHDQLKMSATGKKIKA